MNNPSTQAEQLEIDNMEKKITAIRDAISDPGNGIPVMSQTRALKLIMKWSDKDIKENLEEIRLERGIAAELEKTSQIIKKTGVFDTVDRIYGEPGAEYQEDQQQEGGPEDMGGGAPPAGSGGDFGGGLDDLGTPGADDTGDISGEEGSMPTADMGGEQDTEGTPEGAAGGEEMPSESRKVKKPLINESKIRKIADKNKNLNFLLESYLKRFSNANKKANTATIERAKVFDDSLMINEEFNKMLDSIDDFVKEDK